ncbi:MAG TPA: RNA-binding S4 domain-containing protein [Bauldia sp.]|nr:RNA-binding S4 domain-containing protein [Bauldia sp.]
MADSRRRSGAATAEDDRRRIDRWLWFARFAKTRTGAQKLVGAGHVRVNRDKIDSPGRAIRIGDVLTLALPSGVRVVRVASLGERRGPPAEARTLFHDMSDRKAAGAAPGEDFSGQDA